MVECVRVDLRESSTEVSSREGVGVVGVVLLEVFSPEALAESRVSKKGPGSAIWRRSKTFLATHRTEIIG